jgi:hypothetical protein
MDKRLRTPHQPQAVTWKAITERSMEERFYSPRVMDYLPREVMVFTLDVYKKRGEMGTPAGPPEPPHGTSNHRPNVWTAVARYINLHFLPLTSHIGIVEDWKGKKVLRMPTM